MPVSTGCEEKLEHVCRLDDVGVGSGVDGSVVVFSREPHPITTSNAQARLPFIDTTFYGLIGTGTEYVGSENGERRALLSMPFTHCSCGFPAAKPVTLMLFTLPSD